LAAAFLLAASSGAAQAQELAWLVAGDQGVMRYVIVPIESARDRTAYDRQIRLLCEPGTTCFLNFYTNSTNATVAMPLPDAIAAEVTAIFRRSMKIGAENFEFSCRVMPTENPCF
jgi:hypothetical protein